MALAALLGSIPFGSLVELLRKRRGIDTPPRPIEPLYILAGLLSIAKVFVPVKYAMSLKMLPDMSEHYPPWLIVAVALSAVASDVFPYWLMFKPRGRGLAAALGAVFGVSPVAGVGVLMVWLITLLISDRLSMAALVAGISVPIWLSAAGADIALVWFGVAGCAYVIMIHSSNIAGLLAGTEPRWRAGD
jgi:glycerol-3-phosphate acyltransferase PlsY